jgi:hypothetical protein
VTFVGGALRCKRDQRLQDTMRTKAISHWVVTGALVALSQKGMMVMTDEI